jgi:hypothetical protein
MELVIMAVMQAGTYIDSNARITYSEGIIMRISEIALFNLKTI